MEENQHKKPESEIEFCCDTDKWVMKICRDRGILFNREEFPYSQPDDFANAVIEILEKCFTVKFEKLEPPYDR